MSLISVHECPAGPWLDAAVAQALGGKIAFDKDGVPYYAGAILGGVITGYVSHYSAEIVAAWELLEKLPVESCSIAINRIRQWGERNWVVSIEREGNAIAIEAHDGNLPAAICRAFLLARGIETVEI